MTSPANPRIKAVVQLRTGRHRRRTGMFIAEGTREISRAIEAGLVMRELYRVQEIGLEVQQKKSVAVYEVTKAVMKKLAYRAKPQGILAVFEQPVWDISAICNPQSAIPSLLLVAVGIEKPGNLGAMARSAAAAGASSLLVADGVVDAFNPNAIRASTGAVFTLPIIGDTSAAIIGRLKQNQTRIITAAPNASCAHTDADLAGPIAIVIGSEDTGLSEPWLDATDTHVRIPLAKGVVDSLNASTAAAILLFEAVRQRGA